jgi:DNA-binding winged helix-turn-helix (wHTH) protein
MIDKRCLRVLQGPEAGRELELPEVSPFIIGRDEGCHWRIDHKRISRVHMHILYEAGCTYVQDWHSKNGVYLNGRRLTLGERRPLNDGDTLQLGKVVVVRFERASAQITQADTCEQVITDGLWLDKQRREVYIRNQPLNPRLSREVFEMLRVLYDHEGELLTNETLHQQLWPEVPLAMLNPQQLDTLAYRLRKRLAELDNTHEYIVTRRGEGRLFRQRTA